MFDKDAAIAQLRSDIKALSITLNALEDSPRRDMSDTRNAYVDRPALIRTPLTRPVFNNDVELAAPRRRQKRSAARASVRYEMLKLRKGQTVKSIAQTMPPAYAAVWFAIAESKRTPLTAFELERASGQVKKTVESALWQMRRTYRVIRSVKA